MVARRPPVQVVLDSLILSFSAHNEVSLPIVKKYKTFRYWPIKLYGPMVVFFISGLVGDF